MNRKRDIELIILEVLGCQDENDKKNLQFLKDGDETFSWNDLAKFQNLSAQLSSLLKPDIPQTKSKEELIKKINRLIFGREDVGHTEKFVPQKKYVDQKNSQDIQDTNKIDWGSFSVSDSSLKSKKLNGFEEVKTKTSFVKENSIRLDEIENLSDEEYAESSDNKLDFKPVKEFKSVSPLRKYVLVAISLFIVIISMSVYMLIDTQPEEMQFTEEKKLADTNLVQLEELSYDSLQGIEAVVETIEIPEIEIYNKPQNEDAVLPKSPPNLPKLIEAPLITTEEVVNNEETKVEEQLSVPPLKEVIEETEEPTYFVVVEEMPQPIGGLQGIQAKIKYPEIARRAGVEGKVFVRAFVDESGFVVNAEIVKGIGGGCDEAALDAVLKTKFTPGMQRSKPIKVQVIVPIHFKL